MAINLINNSQVLGTLSITGDGSNATTLTESGGGTFTIDTVSDIILDAGGGGIQFKDDDSIFGKIYNGGALNLNIFCPVANKDIIFKGYDGAVDPANIITALTLDMSDAGWAQFNTGISVGNSSATSTFSGKVSIGTIDEVGSDTDKFLMSDSGVVKYVDGTTLRSYIGAGTGSGNVTSVGITAGTGISVSGSPITGSGSITVTNTAPASASAVDGSGTAGYLPKWSDSNTLTDSTIYYTGDNIEIQNQTASGDISFRATNSSSTTAEYMSLDGGAEVVRFYKGANFNDDVKLTFGDISVPGDLEIWHDEDNSYISDTGTGDLYIQTNGTNMFLRDSSSGDTFIAMNTGTADVVLKQGGNTKLTTKSTGVNITGGFTTSASSSCAGLNMTADISMAGNNVVLDSNGNIELDTSLTSSQTSGTIIKYGSHMSALTAGKVYYGYASMTAMYWGQASQSSASSAKSILALSIGTDADVDGMLLSGVFYSASHGFTIGVALYLSTSGDLTNTVPTTSNYYARVCGYALDSNHIYFNPDNTWVKID